MFLDYYADDVVALASCAWLGPNYQVTSALNIVNPRGQAQTAHRGYHLGFMPLETAANYPEHVHRLSPLLTLQRAVAHCDLPVETGPTMYLPHSQKYVPGYLAAGLPESSRISPGIACNCRWPRATRCSSTPPCSMAGAPTGQPTSGGWPICCTCPRRRGVRWRASTGPGPSLPCIQPCWPAVNPVHRRPRSPM